MNEWREDIKTCLLYAGVEDKPVTFLFSDAQVGARSLGREGYQSVDMGIRDGCNQEFAHKMLVPNLKPAASNTYMFSFNIVSVFDLY